MHDPMCSWCWAFRPSLNSLLVQLPEQITIVRLLGGLAPDSDVPMLDETRMFVKKNWKAIEQQVPGTKFNYDFWTKCKPRRSTYPACRAVIAARNQGDEYDPAMTLAIQQAYYLNARNPSDYSTLIELAEELDLDKRRFTDDLRSIKTDETLQQEIKQSRRFGLNSFPSLLLEDGDKQIRIAPDYLYIETMLNIIKDYFNVDS